MKARLIACLLIALSAARAEALGSDYDGQWSGEIIAEEGKLTECGFDRMPFIARVVDGKFIAESRVFGQRFEIKGDVEADGRVNFWTDWSVLNAGTQQPGDASGKFDGQFAGNRFSARFNTETMTSDFSTICVIHVALSREAGSTTTASPATPKTAARNEKTPVAPASAAKSTPGGENTWIGMLTNHRNQTGCGFRQLPISVEVTDKRFLGSVTHLGTKYAFAGDIDDEGRVNFWADWVVLQGTARNQVDASGKFKGRFEGERFVGRFDPSSWSDTYQHGCSMRVTLRREGSPVTVATVVPTAPSND